MLCVASIQIAYAEPEFSFEFGSFGSGEGKFKSPSGLALDRGSNLLSEEPAWYPCCGRVGLRNL